MPVLWLSLLLFCAVHGQLKWKSCPVYTEPHPPPPNITADCVTLRPPLEWWDNGINSKIDLFVKRVNAPASENRKGQIWLLQGGPGGSSIGLETAIPQLLSAAPEYDIMLIDHRGTGRSFPLECPNFRKVTGDWDVEMEKCLDFLEDQLGKTLFAFNTANAAQDLGYAINETSKETDEVLIYAFSYGTYWAARYLDFYPDQATRVVMDGICPPDLCRFAGQELIQNDAGVNLFNLCATQSSNCRAFLGYHPIQAVRNVLQMADSRTGCPAKFKLSFKDMQQLLGGCILNEKRILMPPFIKMMLRCSSQDIQKLSHFMEYLGSPGKPSIVASEAWNPMLGMNIVLSELFSNDIPSPTERQLLAQSNSLYFTSYTGPNLGKAFPSWTRYNGSTTPGHGLYPLYSKVPLVMLQGTLDGQTSPEWGAHAAKILNQTWQQYISVPYAPHGTIQSSPNSLSPSPCGFMITMSFLTTGEADTSCLSYLTPPDFDGTEPSTQELSNAAFGTPDMWGN